MSLPLPSSSSNCKRFDLMFLFCVEIFAVLFVEPAIEFRFESLVTRSCTSSGIVDCFSKRKKAFLIHIIKIDYNENLYFLYLIKRKTL